jgi:hypothetical protein
MANTVLRFALDYLIGAISLLVAGDDAITALPVEISVEQYKSSLLNLGFLVKLLYDVDLSVTLEDSMDGKLGCDFLSIDLANGFPTSWPKIVASALMNEHTDLYDASLEVELRHFPLREELFKQMKRAGWGPE